jgi:hypothetical protein
VPLIAATDATVPVTVQARANLAPARAFEVVAPIDLSLVFKGWGPLPGVRGVEDQTGPWDHAGARRMPDLTDGSTANEAITEYTPGHSFAYELTDFTDILGRLVSGVRGEWTFTPDGHGTLIRWTYEFKPLPRRAAVVRFGLAPLWRRYMQASVHDTVTAAERLARESTLR